MRSRRSKLCFGQEECEITCYFVTDKEFHILISSHCVALKLKHVERNSEQISLRSSMSFVWLDGCSMWMDCTNWSIDQFEFYECLVGNWKNTRCWLMREALLRCPFRANWFLRWSLECPTNQLHNDIYCHSFPSNCQRAVNASLNRPKIDLHSYFIGLQIYGINNFTKCALWLIVMDLILIFLTHGFTTLNSAQLIAPHSLL